MKKKKKDRVKIQAIIRTGLIYDTDVEIAREF